MNLADRLREWLALKIAPWLYVPYREDREEAFKDLAEVAYLSRDAIWTSPRTLVHVALEQAEIRGRRSAFVPIRDGNTPSATYLPNADEL